MLGSESVPLDACVVLVGTLPLMRHVQLHRRWRPGGWCHFDNLRCSIYYAYFGPHLLNRSYVLLPVVEAIRQADRLFEAHGRGGQVFVRPDPVWKLFRGACVTRGAFESTLSSAAFDPTTLVVVAEPRTVGREWRLVVAHGAVVSGSQYANRGEMDVTPGCPEEVRSFVDRVLAATRWSPDPLFMLDVAESDGALHVVELNAFSCVGWYACDIATVVAAASDAARRST